MNEIGRKGFQSYIDNKYAVPLYESIMTSDESLEANKIMTNIDTYMKEMQQKWIMGEADVDATWDNYIQTINNYGMQRVIELETIAYNRLKGEE